MILAVSRFKVANGLAPHVRQAFLERPRLVDAAPGFLGMETFTESGDPNAFYLVTRWTDAASFHAWHRGDAHHASHQGIPKGLRLDPSFTRILTLDRIEADVEGMDWSATAADDAPLLCRFLQGSAANCYFRADSQGTLRRCNEAAAALLGQPVTDLLGTPLWRHLTAPDAESLRSRVRETVRDPGESFLLNLVTPLHHVHTLRCHLDVQPGSFTLLGEPVFAGERALQAELLELNSQLTVLTRENTRKGKLLEGLAAELQRALDELHSSYWHVRKIREVLPICMDCGKVNVAEASAEAEWEDVVEYLKKHTGFLSHAYCPECAERAMALWRSELQRGPRNG